MHPVLRLLLRLSAIFAIAFFASKPFNFFCNLTSKCQPFYFSNLIPASFLAWQEGTQPIIANFEVTNFREGLEFLTTQTKLETVGNRKNTVVFHVKNTSNKTIKFRPQLIVEPEDAASYIESYQCLCQSDHVLKPQEEKDLPMIFLFDPKIVDDVFDGKNAEVKIRYKI